MKMATINSFVYWEFNMLRDSTNEMFVKVTLQWNTWKFLLKLNSIFHLKVYIKLLGVCYTFSYLNSVIIWQFHERQNLRIIKNNFDCNFSRYFHNKQMQLRVPKPTVNTLSWECENTLREFAAKRKYVVRKINKIQASKFNALTLSEVHWKIQNFCSQWSNRATEQPAPAKWRICYLHFGEWLTEWLSEWVSEWVSEWESESECVSRAKVQPYLW